MRLKVSLEPPFPEKKCWIEIPDHFSHPSDNLSISTLSSINELSHHICSRFHLSPLISSPAKINLNLDGFGLMKDDRIQGILRDGDLISISIPIEEYNSSQSNKVKKKKRTSEEKLADKQPKKKAKKGKEEKINKKSTSSLEKKTDAGLNKDVSKEISSTSPQQIPSKTTTTPIETCKPQKPREKDSDVVTKMDSEKENQIVLKSKSGKPKKKKEPKSDGKYMDAKISPEKQGVKKPSTASALHGPMAPPLSLNNKNKPKGFRKDMLQKGANHIKFDLEENQPEVEASESKEETSILLKGKVDSNKVYYSAVELDKGSPKYIEYDESLSVYGSQVKNQDDKGPSAITNKDKDFEHFEPISEEKYEALPVAKLITIGDHIAYKSVEMSSSYTPEIVLKEAIVITYTKGSNVATVKLLKNHNLEDQEDSLKKFDLPDDETIPDEQEDIVALDLNLVMEIKHVCQRG